MIIIISFLEILQYVWIIFILKID